MSIAYTNYDSAAPDGAAGTGTTFSAATIANMRALRDMAISGRVAGWIQSRTQGTGPDVSRPQYITWLNATLSIGFRVNITWGGSGTVQPTSVLWQWTSAGEYNVTWTDMGTAQANTFDVNDNITATTNSGGVFSLLLEVWTKTLRVVSGLATHIAATGTSVHGLGSMAIQAATAVAIAGGAINATTIGLTTRAAGNFTRAVESFDSKTPALNAAVSIDWGANGGTAVQHNGTHVLSFTGITTSLLHGHLLVLTNLNQFTFPASVSWGLGDIPSIAGLCIVSLITYDSGTNVYASVVWRAV